MEEAERCPQCRRALDGPTCRLVQDACGHKKCRLCLLNDELKCLLCQEAAPPKKKPGCINHTAVITCQSKVCDEAAAVVALPKRKPAKGEARKRNYNNLVIPSHVTVEGDNNFTCTICEKSFNTKYHVKYHLYCSGEKKPFQCEQCKKEFILKAHLETHALTHQNRRPYDCDKCGKKFLEKSKLNRHRFVHATVRAFGCVDCGKAFKNAENLRTHRLIHRPERVYGCNVCEAKFSHSSNLSKHMMTHSSDKSHMCDQCGKRFKLKWALTLHRRGHLKIRSNECGVCKKTFVHAKDLQRHQLIHLDTKGFTCGICGTGFKRKDNLSRHTKNTHPGKKAVVVRNSGGAAKKATTTTSVQERIVDNPNAINVIKSPPAHPPHKEADDAPKREAYVNVPLKLAFKTTAFKNNYNIHRDYVEPKELDPCEPVNIYEKILLPSSPTQKAADPAAITTVAPINTGDDEEEHCAGSELNCQRIFAPFSTPLHYETSFDNKKHAVIKNIKFKLPAKYTKLRVDDDKKCQQEAVVDAASVASVIVNSSPGNNYYDLHWRRRTAQYLASKDN